MRYGIVESGKCVNVAVCDDPDFAASQGWIGSEAVNIGDAWNGEIFLQVPYVEPYEVAVQRINAEFETEMQAVKSLYPESEREGWPQQQLEATAFFIDQQAPTPIIDAMVSESDEDKAEVVAGILAKVAAYSAHYGAALGRKRKKIADLT